MINCLIWMNIRLRTGIWKTLALILGISFFLGLGSTEVRASSYENPLFAYTHLLPSPLTLPAGRFVFGTEVAYGLADFLQIGTGLLQDIYQVYNVQAKLSFIDTEDFALALTLGYEMYNYDNISPNNPNLSVHSWLPGGVMAFSLLPQVALFVGGNYQISNVSLLTDQTKTSGYVEGVDLGSDISWAYSPGKKKLGNVLSAGVTYDATYKIFGFGVSHHWPGLHLGIHYYPNADQYKVQPILAGGAAIDL